MGAFLLTVFFCAFLATARLPTSVSAAVVKYSGNETLFVLLLASSDPSYNSSPSTLISRVNDLLSEANKDGSYQLQLLSFDTQVKSRIATEDWFRLTASANNV